MKRVCRRSQSPYLGLEPRQWVDVAKAKRDHMDDFESFKSAILSNMRDGPLRRLAADIHRVLFLCPDCYGTIRISDAILERVDGLDISHGLRVGLKTSRVNDPLTLRSAFESKIVKRLLDIMTEHKQAALVVLRNSTSTANSVAEVEPSPATSVISAPAKRQRDNKAYDRPTKRMRSKADHPVP